MAAMLAVVAAMLAVVEAMPDVVEAMLAMMTVAVLQLLGIPLPVIGQVCTDEE